jgi:hypothetical protein
MPSLSMSPLRRLFGTVSIGTVPTRHIAVLLYLASTDRKERGSLKEIGKTVGVSENTVWLALRNVYRRGYVKPTGDAPLPDEPPGRDARLIEVTAEGRRALRPFFNVVGLPGLAGFVAVSLAVGGLIGYSYGVALPYLSQYAAVVIALLAGAAGFYAFITYNIWRTAREFRTGQLLKAFKADATTTEE